MYKSKIQSTDCKFDIVHICLITEAITIILIHPMLTPWSKLAALILDKGCPEGVLPISIAIYFGRFIHWSWEPGKCLTSDTGVNYQLFRKSHRKGKSVLIWLSWSQTQIKNILIKSKQNQMLKYSKKNDGIRFFENKQKKHFL